MKIAELRYSVWFNLRKLRVWFKNNLTPAFLLRYGAVLVIALNIFFTRTPEFLKTKFGLPKSLVNSKLTAQTPTPRRINAQGPGPEFLGKAALVVEATSSSILYQKNAAEKLPPASLTKLMTALLILENTNLSQATTISQDCTQVDGIKIGLKPGQRFTVESLLKALLLPSAADAACALGEVLEGSEASPSAKFVQKMNERAKSLGLLNTHFTNSVGLDDEQNFSTAADLLSLTEQDLKFSEFAQIVALPNHKISSLDGSTFFDLKNTNELLAKDKGFKGIKTGQTPKALGCLIFLYERDGHRILGVILGSSDRFLDAQNLVKWVFENYKWE